MISKIIQIDMKGLGKYRKILKVSKMIKQSFEVEDSKIEEDEIIDEHYGNGQRDDMYYNAGQEEEAR